MNPTCTRRMNEAHVLFMIQSPIEASQVPMRPARTSMSPFMRFLVTAAKWVRAAGLPRDPNEPPKPKASPQEWETLGRDLGRAVRKFRDGGRTGD